MNYVQSRNTLEQFRQSANHRLIDRARTLASTENQHRWRRLHVRFSRNLEKRRPHRNSRHHGIAEIFGCLLEVHCRCGNKSPDHAISEARHQVRFKGECRNAFADCGKHRGAGRISAHADHDLWLKFVEHPTGGKYRARQIKEGFQSCAQTHPIQRPDLHELQWKSGGGNQSPFQAPLGSNEEHFCAVAPLQFLGDGDGWDNVPARASARQNRSHEGNYIGIRSCAGDVAWPSETAAAVHYSVCLVTFSSTPMQASVMNKDDPPYEISGRGIPLVGINPSTTLILMSACTTTMLVIPTARNRPNMSWVRKLVRMPRHKKSANKLTTARHPSSPSSSPSTEKMKSVCGSGR